MHTAEQLRAARAAVGMTRAELGDAANVSAETVKRLEGQSGSLAGNSTTLNALRDALVAKDVIFISPGDTSEVYAVGFEVDGK